MDLETQRRIAQAGKEKDPAWYRVHRRVSIQLTRGAIALGLAADHASIGMMLAGLLGAALLVPASAAWNAAGFAVLYLAFLLDKVDGELARLHGTANARGIFLDRIHHRLVEPCLFLAVALHEFLRTDSLVPVVAGFATVVLANAIDENQHLAPYILVKRVREGARLPSGAPPRPSRAWARAAAWFRPLKGFRMFIVALPMFALSYVLEGNTGRPMPTFVLAASACGLAVYLVFQCLYYLREQLETEAHAIAGVLRGPTEPPHARPRREDARKPPLADGDDLMEHSTWRFGTLIVAGGLTLALAAGGPVPARAAGTYWVDGDHPSCSDAGPGTVSNPYCTIGAAVAAQAGPGTTIRIAPGHYPEQVTVPASGAAGNPFVIQGDGTEANPVLVDGAVSLADPALWTPFEGTIWRASSVDWATLSVLAGGTRLVPWGGAPDSVPPGGFRYVAGSGLYVNLGIADVFGNPGAHETRAAKIQHGVFVNGRSWVTVRGLRIRETNDRGVQVTNSNQVVIEDNRIERVQRFGIQAQNSQNVTIRGNRVTASGDHGITLTAGSRGCVVEKNETDHNARPGVRAANGIHLFGAPGNVVRRNRIHHNQDTGLHVQAGSDTTVSYQNVSYANGDHGFDHLGVQGSLHLGDVAYGNQLDGFSFEGVTQNQRMYDCIAVANGLTTGRYNLYVDSTSAIGHISDDNILWNPDGQAPVKFDKIVYASVAAYAAATGQDTRTIQADPLFAAPAVGDFHLLAGSPAIDAANTGLPFWPGTDAEGYAPIDVGGVANTGIGPVTYADRGAYEFGSAGVVGVPGDPPPAAAVLEGVTPNPLAGDGQLAFATTRPGPLAIDVFDARGRHVRQVRAEAVLPAGTHVTPLSVRDGEGRPLAAGIYLYRLRTVDGERGGKFVVLR